MRKNILLYTVALTLLFIIFLFFNRLYQGLKEYSQLTGSAAIINSTFQDISGQIKNAFVLNPDLIKAANSSKADKLFFIDSQSVIRQLNVLKTIVQDPVSIGITKELDAKVRSQLSWIIDSNVPDSIIGHNAPAHIASLISIDSLIGQGIQRNNFLLDGRKQQLHDTINKMKSWMFLFIAFSGIFLIYAISNLSKQKFKRKEKEIPGHQHALDESAVIAVTGQKRIANNINDNFYNTSKLRRGELIDGDQGVMGAQIYPHELIRNSWVINSSDDAILSKTLEGIITSWNYGAEKIFGYTAEEVIGKHISILIPDHLRNEENEIIGKISKGEDVEHYETERIRKDGTVIYVSLTISPVKDPAGNIMGASKIVRDITNQKKTEQKVVNALKEKETVLNRISDGVVSVDNEWRYTFLNDAALATHPMSKEETLGKNIWDVHPDMKGTIFWNKYHEAMDTGKVIEIDDYYAPMNIWFSVKVYPSVDGLTIFYKDVTESKRAEQKLSKTLKEVTDYKFALDEAAIVAITDQKGIILHANDNFCKISKYSEEELIGQDHRIINSGHHPKEFIRNLWVTIANGKIWKGELKNKAKDGSIYWVDTTIVPFLTEEGKPYQYVAIRADITERKQGEENIKATLKEISDYKYALDESSIVAITDQKGIIKYANDNFCKISKYSAAELIGQDHRIINSGHHPKEFIRNLWVTIANGKIWKGELKNKAKDGSIYWVDTTIVPFLTEEGKPYQYVAIRADITERKQGEENIKATLKEITDYKYALDESSIVAITDQKGIIKYANDNFCKISKYSAAELVGQDHRIINSGHHPKEFIRNLWVTIANGEIWKGELKNKAKDGSIYWVDTTIVPFLTEEGKPYQYVAIRADITERKRVEDELASSEMHFRSLIENSAEGISLTDEFSKIFYRSPGAERIIGPLPSETLTSFTHPEDKELIKNKFAEALRNPKLPIFFQSRHLHPSRHYIWLEGTFTNLLHVNGVNAIVSNFRDITFRKEAEEKLIKSEKIYKTIASSIPGSVICLLDSDYRYLLVEGDMIKKLGYSKEKLLGNKAEDVLVPEIFASVQNDFKSVLAGEIITRESRRSGYDIISRYIPLKDDNNMVYAIMTVAIDVTELKNAQRGIIELNRGLEEKIIQRTEQLRKTNIELESFSYSISHDLRAPLRIINGFGQILAEDYIEKLDEEGQRVIGVIMNNAKKMGQLIDDLLSFSKLGRSEMRVSKVNMNHLVTEVLQELKTSGVCIPSGLTKNKLAPAKGDRNLLKQVWVNLISNAIKYSSARKHPLIEIGTMEKQNTLTYYVKDNGAGFNMQYADKLFGVFQRLHKAEEFEGTGVGLALVQRIILRHEGTIWAHAKENEGATFYFTLPG